MPAEGVSEKTLLSGNPVNRSNLPQNINCQKAAWYRLRGMSTSEEPTRDERWTDDCCATSRQS
jgi:hypothetical protein